MSLHDFSYQHWEGRHCGIWRRRWVIALNSLKSCLDNRWARNLVLAAWTIAMVAIGILFLIGQLLVPDSIAYEMVENLNQQMRDLFEGLKAWLTDRPEISVRVAYNMLFYFFAFTLYWLGMISTMLAIPHLISRDLSSRAIIIYSSKAISRFDYFLGKFGTIFGLLSLVWLGPVLATWLAGNLLAQDWSFFWHSRGALFNALLYVIVSMLVISVLSLGISALSAKPRMAMSYWIAFWLVGDAIGSAASNTRFLSISHNLEQIARRIFNLGGEVRLAQENIPFLGDIMSRPLASWLEAPEIDGALAALAVMLALAVVIMAQRVKPE